MGLDVYCYKIKDKIGWKKFANANKEFEVYSSWLWTKYKNELDIAYNKWQAWYDDLINKYENNIISEDEFNEESAKDTYKYSVLDFTSSEESLKYRILLAAQEAAMVEKEELENLYMRKQYWFIQYCYYKFKEYLIDDDVLNVKVLDEDIHYYDIFLNKEDIADIIDKLTAIVNNCNVLINDSDIINVVNKVKIDQYDMIIETEELTKYNKLAINYNPKNKQIEGIVGVNLVDSLFPIYKDYAHSCRPGWNYNAHTFKYYLEEWKKVYDEMINEEFIWICESW